MALQLSLQFPVLRPTAATPKNSSFSLIKRMPVLTQPIIKNSTITRTTKTHQFTVKGAPNNTAAEGEEENPQSNSNNVSEAQNVAAQRSSPDEPQAQPSDDDLSDLGSEIKKAMKEREGRGGGGVADFWSGVAEEIREIEWPAFGKVLGTTGVVLGVIAGSSVVLLTVNAVLAELSDRVFAGRGVQDFFS